MRPAIYKAMKNFDISESGQEAPSAMLSETSRQAREGLATCTTYVRENPWVGLAGAAMLGALVVSVIRPSRHKPTALESIRHWVENAREKMPAPKETTFGKVLRKLHVSV